MNQPTIIILAAGLGTRLGRPSPKALTPLDDGQTILGRQLSSIRAVWPSATVAVVVGFKMDLVMEAAPSCLFVYNDAYDRTNTSKSLLRALELVAPGPAVWLNGDVVLDERVLSSLAPSIEADHSAVCVAAGPVADEEIKYTLDSDGKIAELSKVVETERASGEAIGVNLVAARDRELLIAHLRECDSNDYFERGIETAIAAGLKVEAVDVAAFGAIEVDFDADLLEANRRIRESRSSKQESV